MISVLITDIDRRKSFDLYSMLSTYDDVYNIVLAVDKGSRSKKFYEKLFDRNVYFLRSHNFESDLEYISRSEGLLTFLPIEEDTIRNFLLVNDTLRARFRYSLPSLKMFDSIRDKLLAANLYEQLDILHPKTLHDEDLGSFRGSVLLKPAKGSGSRGIMSFALPKDIDSLRELSNDNCIIQEKLPNGDKIIGYFALAKKGTVVDAYAHQRLITIPMTGGVSVISETISLPDLMKLAARIVNCLQYDGLIMLEFLRVDDRYYIIEANPRLWGSILLAKCNNFSIIRNYISICNNLDPIKEDYVKTRLIWPLGLIILFFTNPIQVSKKLIFDFPKTKVSYTFIAFHGSIRRVIAYNFNLILAKIRKK